MRRSTTAARRRAGRAVARAGLVAGLAGSLLLPAASGTAVLAPAAADDRADWTMMVYVVADTENIGPLMLQVVSELTGLPDDADVDIVALVDNPERTGGVTLPGVGDFTTAKLLSLEGGRFEEVRDLGEVSMGRPDTLATFIEQAAAAFPADHYGLTLMDHGGGNTGGYLDVSDPGGARQMTVPEIRAGMIAGMQAAGIDRFDVLYHSACLMSNYETASALAPLARTMAGSEEVMLVYAMLEPQGFAAVQDGGDGEAAAEGFLDGYVAQVDADAPGDAELQDIRDLVALSAVDGDAVQTLDQAMESFAQVAVAHMDEIVTDVGRARADALEFVSSIPSLQGASLNLIDLGDFLRHLDDLPDEVAVARDSVFAALEAAVTHQVTGRGTEQATGLNVFFPTTPAGLGSYLDDGTAPAGWAEFLAAYYAAGAGDGQQPAGFGFASPQAQVLVHDATGIKIQGQLVSGASAQVVEAETQVVTRLGGQDRALAAVLPAYVDAGAEGAVQGVWDHSVTVLTDGRKNVPATAAYQAQSGGLVGTFLAQYRAPGGATTDIGVRLLLSSQGEIQSVTVFDLAGPDSTSASGLTLEVGGTVTPYLFAPASGVFQQLLSSQSIEVTPDLAVGFTQLPAGQDFDMAVVVGDVAGNHAAASTSQKVQ